VSSPTAYTYGVVATSSASCVSTERTVDVTVNPLPTISSITSNPANGAVCLNSSITLTTAGSNVSSYQWSKRIGTSGGFTDITGATSASLSDSPTQNTTYRVIGTSSFGCVDTGAQTFDVTVNPLPTIQVTPASPTITQGSSTPLTASGAASYSWSPADGLDVTTGATVNASPSATTTYTVTGTSASGCLNTQQVTVTVSKPLPVELISFTAAWTGKHPTLNWATASERNSAYFDVERSVDGGRTFKVVGQVAGAGTASTRTDYNFDDMSLAQATVGTVFYRLRQVDLDKKSNTSVIRSVLVPAAAQTFQAGVYPNPYENTVTVQFNTLGAGAVYLTVHDVLGQRLLQKTVNYGAAGEQELKLPQAASWPTGVYYLTIRQGNQQKVVKMSRR
jgi:hypothetical protein